MQSRLEPLSTNTSASSGHKVLAIDTETVALTDGQLEIPELVLISVSSGEDHALLYPDQLPGFIDLHWDWKWVTHNAAFDYWALSGDLGRWGGPGLDGGEHHRKVLREIVDRGDWHDTMILDQLVQLAKSGGREGQPFRKRNLDEVSKEYTGLSVPKDDPYRLRYGEIRGERFEGVDPGFLDYAIGDAITTFLIFGPLFQEAERLLSTQLPGPDETRVNIYPYAGRKYGVLSESIQVKASIALDEISRRGLAIDPAKVDEIAARLRGDIDERVEWIRTNYPHLLDYYKEKKRAGQLKVNKNTGVPKFQLDRFRGELEALANDHGIKVPRTPKDGKVAASVKVWKYQAHKSPLLEKWTGFQDTTKLYQFITQVRGRAEVHPEYNTMVLTGRTSSYKGRRPGGLNIQQMPREAWFRELFVSRPGKKLVAVDYSFIELRTLASVCLAKYGRSKLAEVIIQGVDPHVHTAALASGIDLVAFKELKSSDPKRFKEARQAAKAINFGVPGGLGAEKLTVYAKENYGVFLTKNQAADLKKKLITEVYPELETYLSDQAVEDLALNLRVSPSQVRSLLEVTPENEGIRMASVKKIIGGKAYKADGTPYNEYYVKSTWRALERLARDGDPYLAELIARQEGSPGLEERLFRRTVSTLTGRLRAGVRYTEARNTPFQGLAADGAKLALWELHKEGFDVVAFIHDEIVFEVDEDRAEELAERGAEIMNRAMEEVLYPGIPSATEYAIGGHWVKA